MEGALGLALILFPTVYFRGVVGESYPCDLRGGWRCEGMHQASLCSGD